MGLLVPLRPPDNELVRHEGHEEEDVDGEVDHLSIHQRHRGHTEGRHVRQTLLPLDQALDDVVLTIPESKTTSISSMCFEAEIIRQQFF